MNVYQNIKIRMFFLTAAVILCSVYSAACSSAEPDAVSADGQIQNSCYYAGLYGDDDFVMKIRKVQGGNGTAISSSGTSKTWPDGKDRAWTLQDAVSSMQGGGTLLIKGGTYRISSDGNVCIDMSSLCGTADSYINIMPVPGDKVVFDGSGVKGSDGLSCFYMDGTSYARISGITIRGFSDPAAVHAFDIENASDHIIIDNCDITDICVDSPELADHCANAVLCYNSSDTVQTDILIADNNIHDCATGWSEAISVDGNAENVNIIGNLISETGNIGIDLAGNYGACPDSSKDFTRNSVVYGNRVTGCRSAYGDTAYGIYADGAHDVMLEANIIKGCSGSIEVGAEQPSGFAQNVTVRNNLICCNSENELTVGGWTDDSRTGTVIGTKIINNTIINTGDNGSEGVITLSKADGVTLVNNIICNTSSYDAVTEAFGDAFLKNVSSGSNLFAGRSDGAFAGELSVRDPSDVFTDAESSDYTLREGSPAVNAGADTDAGSYDLAQQPRRVGKTDIGAYERQDR